MPNPKTTNMNTRASLLGDPCDTIPNPHGGLRKDASPSRCGARDGAQRARRCDWPKHPQTPPDPTVSARACARDLTPSTRTPANARAHNRTTPAGGGQAELLRGLSRRTRYRTHPPNRLDNWDALLLAEGEASNPEKRPLAADAHDECHQHVEEGGVQLPPIVVLRGVSEANPLGRRTKAALKRPLRPSRHPKRRRWRPFFPRTWRFAQLHVPPV